MKRPRSAAFMPLHLPHCERYLILSGALEPWTLKRHKCRAPIPAASAATPAALSGLGILAAKRTGDAVTVTALEAEIASQPRKMFPKKLPVAGASGTTHESEMVATVTIKRSG